MFQSSEVASHVFVHEVLEEVAKWWLKHVKVETRCHSPASNPDVAWLTYRHHRPRPLQSSYAGRRDGLSDAILFPYTFDQSLLSLHEISVVPTL